MDRRTMVNVYPALYTHKGTPIRYYLKLSDSSSVLVEPLITRAEGLVLLADTARRHVELPAGLDGKLALLSGTGQVVQTVELPAGVRVERVEATVIYPNGSTWEGAISEGSISAAGLMVWGWELAHRLKNCDVGDLFGFSKNWYETPTTVVFFDHDAIAGCLCSHACPKQCDLISKFL